MVSTGITLQLDPSRSKRFEVPAELLGMISKALDFKNLRSWNEACKAFRSNSMDAFESHCFNDVQCFVASPPRRERLLTIIGTPPYLKHVRQVTLSIDCFEDSRITGEQPTALERCCIKKAENLAKRLVHGDAADFY